MAMPFRMQTQIVCSNRCRVSRALILGIASVIFAHTTAADQGERDGGVRSDIVVRALTLIDTPYRYGGTTPQGGFDCSGLVRYVYHAVAARQLPRRSEDIGKLGEPITRSQLEPGDLVFFNTLGPAYSHVAIYIGDGRFLHAPARGGRVRVEALNDRYWQTRFDGARRLIDAAGPRAPFAPQSLQARSPPNSPLDAGPEIIKP